MKIVKKQLKKGKVLKQIKRNKIRQTLDGYKKDYANARRAISESKRQSWRN